MSLWPDRYDYSTAQVSTNIKFTDCLGKIPTVHWYDRVSVKIPYVT